VMGGRTIVWYPGALLREGLPRPPRPRPVPRAGCVRGCFSVAGSLTGNGSPDILMSTNPRVSTSVAFLFGRNTAQKCERRPLPVAWFSASCTYFSTCVTIASLAAAAASTAGTRARPSMMVMAHASPGTSSSSRTAPRVMPPELRRFVMNALTFSTTRRWKRGSLSNCNGTEATEIYATQIVPEDLCGMP